METAAVIIPRDEQTLRLQKTHAAMDAAGIDCGLVCTATNIYYLTGRVFSGWVYLPPRHGAPVYIVKRPVHLEGERCVHVRKPESIPAELTGLGVGLPEGRFGLELGACSYNTVERLLFAMGQKDAPSDISVALSQARSVKTDYEIGLIRRSAAKHERVYRQIPSLFRPGMSDTDLQIEIERLSRMEGCLGQFRIAGDDMELYMGNILVGDNADAPSPYDFAMGGAGADPSLPVGANGTFIRPGDTVMVDMNGNFSGYMTDMTRCFRHGRIAPKAMDAHQVSIDICRELAAMGNPGTEAKALYRRAEEMAAEAGLAEYFMGHRQKAGFVGHGVGIEVNELPVLAPRSRQILQSGNVIAIEPKFVIPGTGAVGIENTYLVTPDRGMESLTHAPEEMIALE